MQLDFWNTMKAPEPGTVYAPMDGEILPLEKMPDTVFADGTLGEGVCLLPTGGHVVSPVSGTVRSVAETGHAFCITADDGAQLMLHIGVDTVSLKGACFHVHVRNGAAVKKGELLCTADLNAIQRTGLMTHTAIVLVNGDEFRIDHVFTGKAKSARTAVFSYSVK